MRNLLTLSLGLVLLVGTARVGLAARCSDEDPNGSKVAAARAQAATACPCGGFPNHGQYVKCVVGQAKTLSSGDNPTLPKSCKGAVKKCAAKSTCGKPGTPVTCCIPTDSGTKCKTKKDAAHCRAPGVVGHCASCCDACPTPGSGPSCGGPSPSGSFLD